MELFQLFGSIFVDDKQAKESIAKTESKMKKMTEGFIDGTKKVAEFGKKLGAVTAAGATAIGVLVTKTSDQIAEIDKLSKTTGMTVDEYQRWDGVMKKYGYSMEQASGDLAALGEKAMDAAAGAGEGAELFGKLGVVVTDASGKLKSQEQIFNETITALQGMENATERNAIASALLSTTGEELAPILAMTNDELQKMKGNSNVIPQDQIDKATQFKKQFDDLKNKISAAATTIATYFMPYMIEILDWCNANFPNIQAHYEGLKNKIDDVISFVKSLNNWFREHKDLLDIVAIAIGTLTVAIIAFNAQNILTTAGIYALIAAEKIHAAVTAISTTATTAFGAAMAFLTSPVTLVIAAIGALIAVGVLLYKNWDEVKAFAISTWEKIKNAIINPIENAKNKIKGIIDTIKGFFNFTVTLPNIKLPHFSVTPKGWEIGDLLKGKIPKLGIEWYAKAMDDGMILDKPTIFGAANGKLLGAGEAGSETIVGTKSLMSMIQQAVDNNSNRSNVLLEEMVSLLQIVSKNQSKYLMLDKDTLIGAISDDIDMALGNTTALRLRGVR